MPPSLPDRIGLLGLGVEGESVLRALARWGYRNDIVVISDRPGPARDGIRWADERGLKSIDLLIRSPGFAPHHPARQEADALGVPQTTATRLFLIEAKSGCIHVIGITGSKGKSTTTTLASLFLIAAGKTAPAIGNIGAPALDALTTLRAGDFAVLEMSSYQCADLDTGPQTGVLLGLFPEHMDWHGGVKPYYEAKLRLLTAQAGKGHAVVVASSVPYLPALRGVPTVVHDVGGLHATGGWFRDADRRLWSDASMRLRGQHNRDNALAAYAATAPLGVTPSIAESVLAQFRGLPHRQADLGDVGGIRWVDDAISTAPEAIAVALNALAGEVDTLICGGQDRGYDVTTAIEAIERSGVRNVICLPDTGAAIAQGLANAHEVDSLALAVELARTLTAKGRTVLFSPGGPSYHRWKNFEARGAEFIALVRKTADAN